MTHLPALERLAECFAEMTQAYGTKMSVQQLMEHAIDAAQVVLVDMMDGTPEDTDLERALRGYLYYTRPHNGAYGQSMENTMAIEADRRLRRAAAHQLKGE